MNLNQQYWYVRWFFHCITIIRAFKPNGRDAYDYMAVGTNLCQFMRISLVWAPLIVTMHLFLYAGIIFVLFVNPVLIWGLQDVSIFISGFLAGTATFLGLVYLLSMTSPFLQFGKKVLRTSVTGLSRARTKMSFLYVVWVWLTSVKRQMCPLIRFVEEQKP